MTVARRLAPAALLLAGAFCPAPAAPPETACAAKSCPSATPLVTKVYPVADLVILVHDGPAPACPAPCPGTVCSSHPVKHQADGPAKPAEMKLVDLLTHAVAPETWEKTGGVGRVEYLPLTMSLVVSATPGVQEQVADTLKALRKLQDQQVAVELRFVSVTDDFCRSHAKEIGLEDGVVVAPKAPMKHRGLGKGTLECDALKVSFLDDKQVFRLMECIQGDTRSSVMQAPKITMFNGQTSTLDVGEAKFFGTGINIRVTENQLSYETSVEPIPLGLHLQLQPTISADRRFVRVQVKGEMSSLDSPEATLSPIATMLGTKDPVAAMRGSKGKDENPVLFTQYVQIPEVTSLLLDQTLAMPDGKTAVLRGWKRMAEPRTESGPPVLSKIPYLNRLFKNTSYGREAEDILVLITPRIIVQEEEETKVGVVATAPPVLVPAKYEVVEEQEETGCCHEDAPCCKENAGCCPATACPTGEVCKLVKAYHAACAAGRRDEATRLAVQALALDPTCFGKPCCTAGY